MKKIIIFHGTGANPSVSWYPWLAQQLKNRGYQVEQPYYPELNQESIDTFLSKVLSNHVFDENTIVIGHSGGAALLLSILEHIKTPVHAAYLVAGYVTPPNQNTEPVLQASYNWDLIKHNVKELYIINSINDPYGCDAVQGRIIFDNAGGTLIIKDEGHFGSEFQDYPEFEFLNRLIG